MEDDIVVVAILGVRGKVLDCPGAFHRMKPNRDIATSCMDDCAPWQIVHSLLSTIFCGHDLHCWLLIEDISAIQHHCVDEGPVKISSCLKLSSPLGTCHGGNAEAVVGRMHCKSVYIFMISRTQLSLWVDMIEGDGKGVILNIPAHVSKAWSNHLSLPTPYRF